MEQESKLATIAEFILAERGLPMGDSLVEKITAAPKEPDELLYFKFIKDIIELTAKEIFKLNHANEEPTQEELDATAARLVQKHGLSRFLSPELKDTYTDLLTIEYLNEAVGLIDFLLKPIAHGFTIPGTWTLALGNPLFFEIALKGSEIGKSKPVPDKLIWQFLQETSEAVLFDEELLNSPFSDSLFKMLEQTEHNRPELLKRFFDRHWNVMNWYEDRACPED
ncbi:hypothetical protein KKH43_03055 [Patescibacteria group bacterium]|nr:hypothetical protein [Patescibacteria group bacterium]